MNQFQDYKDRKERILSLLEKSHQFLEKNGKENEASALKHLETAVREGKFSIMVTGQFSSGKSTFLNALMGERILPSFTEETTATLNYLRSVEESPNGKPMIRIHYRNGETTTCDEVSLNSIEKYVSTSSQDINVVNDVESVELFIDSEILNNGVSLVDSPGLNGTAEGHAEVTKQEFRKTHAGIFMFNASAPGQKTDYNILHEMKSQCDSIIFVLNKISQINDWENETPEMVIENLRKNYKVEFPDETLPEIWPIDSMEALVARNPSPMKWHEKLYEAAEDREELLQKSRIEDFESRLIRYLTQGERTKAELLSPIEHLQKTLSTYRDELQTEYSVINQDVSLEEINQYIEKIREEINDIENILKNKKLEIKKGIRQLKNNASDAITAETIKIKRRQLSKIENSDEDLEEFEDSAKAVIRKIENEMKSLIQREIENFENKFREFIGEKFENISEEINDRINNSIMGDYTEIQKMRLDHSLFDIDVDLEGYISRRKELKTQLLNIVDQMEEGELTLNRSLSLEDEKKRIRQEMASARQEFSINRQSLGSRPVAVERQRHVKRGKHFFEWLFSAGDRYQVEFFTSDEAGNSWDWEKQRIEDEYNDRISFLNTELMNLGDFKSSIEVESDIRRASRKEAQLREELKELEEERDMTLAKERKKRTRKAQQYLEDMFETFFKDTRDQTLTRIKEGENKMIEMASDLIKIGLEDVLVAKQKEYDDLNNRKNSTTLENEQLKDQIQDKLNVLGQELLPDVLSLRQEIQSIEPDKIVRS